MADQNHALDELNIQQHKHRISALRAELYECMYLMHMDDCAEITGILSRNERSCLTQMQQIMENEASWIVEMTSILKNELVSSNDKSNNDERLFLHLYLWREGDWK